MENKKIKSYEEALKELTPVEIRVLEWVEQGLTSIEIAKKLGKLTLSVPGFSLHSGQNISFLYFVCLIDSVNVTRLLMVTSS